MRKALLISAACLVSVAFIFILFPSYLNQIAKTISPEVIPTQTLIPIESAKSQLEDVEKKIEALPDLEKDIFTKCMESSKGTATDIRTCQESTQEQVSTLAQDLFNLKKTIEDSLTELSR